VLRFIIGTKLRNKQGWLITPEGDFVPKPQRLLEFEIELFLV